MDTIKRLGLCVLLVCCFLYAACSSALPISMEQQSVIPLTTAGPPKEDAKQTEAAAKDSDKQPAGGATVQPVSLSEMPSSFAYTDVVKNGLGLGDNIEQYQIWITYVSDELFSCLVERKDGESSTLMPYTYSLQQQRACHLGDFFSTTNTGWKSLLPDLVTQEAVAQGLVLLCDVPPVTENHPFYIRDNGIVLLYRPYEIATFEAGSPQFVIDMQQIADYTTGAFGIGYAP